MLIYTGFLNNNWLKALLLRVNPFWPFQSIPKYQGNSCVIIKFVLCEVPNSNTYVVFGQEVAQELGTVYVMVSF